MRTRSPLRLPPLLFLQLGKRSCLSLWGLGVLGPSDTVPRVKVMLEPQQELLVQNLGQMRQQNCTWQSRDGARKGKIGSRKWGTGDSRSWAQVRLLPEG